jgi:GTP-binding protein HflX
MKARWQGETNGNAIFISALERTHIDELRKSILDKVRELYRIRYPYKTDFFY